MIRAEAEDFLYREARLMDEHRYREWFQLWTEDATYWVPISPRAGDVAIINDDYSKLADRITYLETGTVLGAHVRPSLRRFISNVEILGQSPGETAIAANFLLIEAYGRQLTTWAGQTIHTLRHTGEGTKIASKKVALVNSTQPLPPIQFLL